LTEIVSSVEECSPPSISRANLPLGPGGRPLAPSGARQLGEDGQVGREGRTPSKFLALRRPRRGRTRRGAGAASSAIVDLSTAARIEAEGWEVEIADAQNVKGLAPLACKTDRIDSKVLAVLSQRDLVPAIWLPDSKVREERELARFRLHLVKHKSALKVASTRR
jgi:hypothetical protein